MAAAEAEPDLILVSKEDDEVHPSSQMITLLHSSSPPSQIAPPLLPVDW